MLSTETKLKRMKNNLQNRKNEINKIGDYDIEPISPPGTVKTPSSVIGTVASSLSQPKSWVPKNSTNMYPSGTVRSVRVVVGYFTSLETNFAFIFMSCFDMIGGILDRLDEAISAGRGGTERPADIVIVGEEIRKVKIHLIYF